MAYNPKTLAERLKQARKATGYSLEKVAELCNVQQYQTVSKWENGKVMPSLEKLLALCNIYKCELGYLLGEYDCKTRTATDIHKETGLSEIAISRLSPLTAAHGMRLYSQQTKDRQTALNAILEFNGSDILELIHEYLYRDEEAVELKDGRILSPETIIESYMLEINAELKFLRKQIKGGSENGQH